VCLFVLIDIFCVTIALKLMTRHFQIENAVTMVRILTGGWRWHCRPTPAVVEFQKAQLQAPPQLLQLTIIMKRAQGIPIQSPKKQTVKGQRSAVPAVDGAALLVAPDVPDSVDADVPSATPSIVDTAASVLATDVHVDQAEAPIPVAATLMSSATAPAQANADVPDSAVSVVISATQSTAHRDGSVHSPDGANRARFMANAQPQRVCCNLSIVGVVNPNMRFSFEAVVFVVYPASSQPDRRHVLLVDSTGCAGLTVWGAHVPQFTFATVGCVVKFTKLGMIIHNGKKSLSMGRDTIVQFVPSSVESATSRWWNALSSNKVLRIIDVHDCEDDSIVNVAGIVGLLSSETKRVRADNKDLMTMRLTDHTGHLDVRSWNHSETEFKSFLEKPLLLQRLRVTSYAGIKICELLDGSGTIAVSEFDGKEALEQYWKE